MDTNIGDFYGHIWEQHQASTQFQGKGSSHDLAALLLTETIQYSLHCLKPLFVLYLDARSAFELVRSRFLINNLYHYGIQDQGLIMIYQRLKHRKTICEWNGQLMGPVIDLWGVEQGGRNSSELYKVFDNAQIEVAQDSNLGVFLGGAHKLVLSAIGQADDVALVSNDIFAIQHLLHLSLQYCMHHHMKLRADKTKLQAFSNKNSDNLAYYAKVVNPIHMNDEAIEFTSEAEHVDLIRSGNLPHITGRFSANRKSLAAVLPLGLAQGQRGNLAASLRINSIYATPVLLSGLGSLILSAQDIKIVDSYLKRKTQNLQGLMNKTPDFVVYFLGGSLPGTALLYQEQFSIFGMISRLKGSPLYTCGMQS